MNSTEALHLAYLHWDEQAIRDIAVNQLKLVIPKDRLFFWMYIYGAVLFITDGVALPEDVPPDLEEDEAMKGCFSWWQLREVALQFAVTHPKVQFEPHLGRFRYCGLTYYIPKELCRVTHPNVLDTNKLADQGVDEKRSDIQTPTKD